MKNVLTKLCAALLLCVAAPIASQVTLVKNGKPSARIVAGKATTDSVAAHILQDFVSRITHARIPIVSHAALRPGDVVIGQGNTEGLTEDGFRLETKDAKLYISSGGDKGSIYGVMTLLESYFGVSCYAAGAWQVPEASTLRVPKLNVAENPAFRYRQSQNYGLASDPLYRYWLRLEEPGDVFVPGYWVHTFSRLVPVSEFGESHPEYYSFIGGERRPGSASQLCLTNPEVLEIVAHRVDSIFKAHPQARMISVSQNDGNDTYCTCPNCQALDAAEGGPSGSLIHFINQVAERFPEKEISTLAYQYTMQPPTHVKPLPNVNIMLCNIDCRREVPLTDNATGREFVKAIKGWSNICNNLFIWDYGINFDNYLVPFPNFPILQPNLKLFQENHATMLFSQIASPRGAHFSEMRTYMAAKLMWNPALDTDSLMRSFMDGYYGAAASYLYQYEMLLEGALLGSEVDLWIYDTALSHKEGMYSAPCRKRYNELFDQAEAAVANNQTLLDRVHMARLPLQYTELEMMRAEGGHAEKELKEKLDLFTERAAALHVDALNERDNHPQDYGRLYAERYFPGRNANLAKGASIRWITPPAAPYRAAAESALTDEYLAGDSSKEPGWIGWQGDNGVFILDMHQVKEVSSIGCDFIHQVGQWSLFPKQVSYSYSVDGKTFYEFGRHAIAPERRPQTLFYKAQCTTPSPVQAQYIKVEIENQGICPGWHYGAGHPSWFFMDEVTVQ